GEQW
ncbi:exonuclease, partial [Escherichia coli EC1870]